MKRDFTFCTHIPSFLFLHSLYYGLIVMSTVFP
nr:MAG TPA: hypothetical protein [Caudoviricetes sp.]